jgi:TctA family transporter
MTAGFEIAASLIDGLGQAFTWPAAGLLVIGVLIGLFVGLLPGLGGAATLALLLPATFGMDPLAAFALLMGTISVTATAGDITSILFGVPGEAVSAAIVVDGHAMARRGEAGRALGAALTSSLLGAAWGALALVLAIPVARPLLFSFGSPELFMLSVLGVTFLAPLVGRTPTKGLVAGGLGLWLATVGLDPVDASPRYTFGWTFLLDGIGVLPAALGLFAVPEALGLAASAPVEMGGVPNRLRDVRRGVVDALARWPLVLRCSAIGLYIGMLPGMGASVSQWVAYAHAARRRSSRPERDGTVDRVIGPSAANNATLSGALIPMLVFGIPGSLSTALLLSALVIQGVVPGPTMLLPEAQGGHLGFVFSLMWFTVLANLLVVVLCLRAVGPIARVTTVRGTLLFPGIMVLVFLGAFTEKNAIEDLFVTAAMGALGWTMVRQGWPRPPLLLGLVLGRIAENRLFLSTSLYGWDWLARPVVLALAALAVLSLAGPAVRWFRTRQIRRGPPARTGERRVNASVEDLAFTAGLMMAAAAALWMTSDFGPTGRFFPRMILLVVLALSSAHLLAEWRARGDETNRPSESAGDYPIDVPASQVDPTSLLWAAALPVAIWVAGFTVAAPLMVLLYLRIGARERWVVGVAGGLATLALIWGVMGRILLVPFPDGALVQLLEGLA